MAEVSREDAVVNARILYWGVEGAGKSSNLRTVSSKLRPDNRGDLREMPTRVDPTVTYEVLPIELGDIGGVRTRIQLIAAPGHPDQAPTRKQLLDQVDGVVLVVDAQRDRIEENLASFEELRSALADYGRALEEIPLVVQYNKRDLGDPYVLEELHKRLDVRGAAAFEAVATETTGVLQTLSTISKRVIRALRDQGLGATPGQEATPPGVEPRTVVDVPVPTAPPPAPEPEEPARPEPTPTERMEQAILQEAPDQGEVDATVRSARDDLDAGWDAASAEAARKQGISLGSDLTIVSVGEATRAGDRAVRVPVVLGDGEGRSATLVLTLTLDPLVE